MSAQANIIAYDGAATPTLHTLVPVGTSREKTEGSRAEWRENILTLPKEAQVSVMTQIQMLKSGVERVALTVKVPVMEAVSGQNAAGYTAAPKVAFEDTIVVVGYFSSRSAAANRRLVRQLAANIFNGISTSVTPVTTGPSAEAFDSSISAS